MGIPKSPSVHFAIVLGLTACTLAGSLMLRRFIAPNFFLPFLAVVLVSSWFLGRSAGLVATVAGTAVIVFFFIRRPEAASVLTFVFSALVVTYLAAAVQKNRAHLEATLSSIGDAVVVTDRGEFVTFLNPVAEGMTGWKVRDALKRKLGEVLTLRNEKTGENMAPPIGTVLLEGKSFQSASQKVLISRDGHQVFVEESGAPIRDAKARITGAIFIFRDVTSRREVQDQASQSQKMDAVQRLAAGVAGDFNNLLTVITGYSEMLRQDLAEGNHLRRFADEIYLAGDRAAGLTRQLLALGRAQAGQMKVLEPNTIVAGMETMLRRLMGSQVDLMILQSPGVGRVKGDPAQLEQVIVNLAMNSRDAMPDGGKFVVEVSNIDIEACEGEKRPGINAGSYVMLAVSDTGTGMDTETRGRLFEPFFTTKEKGKASGLGLSIVYGIVQQCRGHINVYSQLGSGTIFEIYLPREMGAVENLIPVNRRISRPRGSETILVADDEDGVRKLVHAVLATNGYNVMEAHDGREALAMYEANRAHVDMVLTDIVMPHMTGLELGERLAALDPQLRVLYISGYRDSPIVGAEGERERIFLHKPFTPDALLARVRELLDRPLALRKEA